MNRNEEEIDEIIDEAEDNLFDHQDKILDEIEDNLFGDQSEPNLSTDKVDFKAQEEIILDRLENEFKKLEEKEFEDELLKYPKKVKEFINRLDIFIYALASAKDEIQFKFIGKCFEIEFNNENSLEIQKSFQEVIRQYRLMKQDKKFAMYVHEDNFDNIAYAIARRLFRSHVAENLDLKARDPKYLIKMPCLKPEIIKHIITKVAEWERDK